LAGILSLAVGLLACTSPQTSSVVPTNPRTLESIAAPKDVIQLPVNANRQLDIIGIYSDGSRQSVTADCTFASSDTNIATVTKDGLLHTIAKGTATIQVSCTEGMATRETTFTVDVWQTVNPPITTTGFPGNRE
jgi:pullulanase